VASRKEQKEALRREREEREAEAAAAAQRRRTLGYALAAALVLAVIVAVGAVALSGGDGDGGGGGDGDEGLSYPEGAKLPARKVEDLEPAAKAAGCRLESYPNFGRGHTPATVTYKTNPPTSGDHDPAPAPDRLFGVAPRKEALVHTLEHGRVVFQFDPKAPEEVRGQLRALYDEDPLWVAITPNNTGMPYEVAAVAWRQLLGCRRWSPQAVDALRAFRDRYRDRAPEPASQT
jgi:hypothetical protein